MSDITNFFAHGSRWVRADFHLHTRQDKEFKDTGSGQDFVARYIAALKKACIQVGLITNHNKFNRDEFKELRKAARKENIHLMPGVELSVKDGKNGIHTLVLFHEDWIDNQNNEDYTKINQVCKGLSFIIWKLSVSNRDNLSLCKCMFSKKDITIFLKSLNLS